MSFIHIYKLCIITAIVLFIYSIRHVLFYKNIEVPIEKCNCSRTFSEPIFNLWDEIYYSQTTCSQSAWRRGQGQKVMAYSYYSDDGTNDEKSHGYIKGIEENIRSIKEFYPGWLMRLYFDVPESNPLYKNLCKLVCKNDHVDLCNIRNLPGRPLRNCESMFGRVWRFFPTLDRQVDIIGSRDLDSVFSKREVAAVNEWMASDKILHAMRDHYQHGTEILAGLWETDLRKINARTFWEQTWEIMIVDSDVWVGKSGRSQDQALLTRHVWNIWGKNNVMHHDSFLCQNYLNSTPWPVKRENGINNFVGAVFKRNMTIDKECPEKCRKKKDWKFC